MARKTTLLDVLVVAGMFWLGGAVAMFLAIPDDVPVVFRFIGAAAWIAALPLYAHYRRGE